MKMIAPTVIISLPFSKQFLDVNAKSVRNADSHFHGGVTGSIFVPLIHQCGYLRNFGHLRLRQASADSRVFEFVVHVSFLSSLTHHFGCVDHILTYHICSVKLILRKFEGYYEYVG